MNMKGLESSDKQTQQNKKEHEFQFNAQTEREESFGLFWDETKYRTYDIQLGRFNHVDPKAEEANQEGWTPYHYAFNNPIRYNDPMGLHPIGDIIFMLTHPLIAMRMGYPNADKTGINGTAIRLAQNSTLTEARGGNALRHMVWQTMLTEEFGEEAAKEVGLAHEGLTYDALYVSDLVGYSKPSSLMRADTEADLQHNEIARSEIASKDGETQSPKEIALAALEFMHKEGFYEVVTTTDENGKKTHTTQKTQLTDKEYNQAKESVDSLNEDGQTIGQYLIHIFD
jgi:RHS repeat-associated protein